MTSILPDTSTPFGERVARRLRNEQVIWLTTTGVDGTPQPNPVWFLWDGQTFLIYNRADAKRLEHIRRNPRVALNFDTDGDGGGIVVITGEAQIEQAAPPPEQVTAYLDKYREGIADLGSTAESFAASYSVVVRVRPAKVRGF